MAEWFVEGLVKRLAGWGDWAGDPVARMIFDHAVFHIVPNMNPDGSVLGNLRTNAAGANLNREWMEPDAARSPEVLAVRDAIHALGCDLFFDIHGDEALPYVFVAGSEMLPGFTEKQALEQKAFIECFKQASPGFPGRVRLRSEQVPDGRVEAGVEVRRQRVRMSVADARNAVQGQRESAGRAGRMERRA